MKRSKVDGLLAKIEGVSGTDAAPVAGTNGIQVDEHLWGTLETDHLEKNTRENATGSAMGRHGGAQPAGRYGKVTLTAALKGAGVAYAGGVRPEIDVLLRAAGLAGVVSGGVGAEQVAYTPVTDELESATLHVYAAGSLFKLVGSRGKLSISAIAARIGFAKFEIWGRLIEGPSDAALPAIVYPRRAIRPPVAASAALLLDGYGPSWKSFEFNTTTDVQARPRGNAPGGHAGYEIVDYAPEFSTQIDSPVKAAFDPWALEAAGTEFPWSLAVGAVQYNHWYLEGSNGRVTKVPPQEDSGFAMINLGIQAMNADAAPFAPFSLVFS